MIQHFLLVFDRDAGKLIEIESFGTDSDRAVAAYADRERELPKDSRLEVVLIGSDSIETIRKTHANYFDGVSSISKYFDMTATV